MNTATLILWLAINALPNPNIHKEISKSGIQHPNIVYAQYVLETGRCKSRACKEDNNLFGFMYKGKVMSFESKLECIRYYKKWQNKRYKGGDYYQFLTDIGYASDPTYIQKLKQIKVPQS